MRPQATAQQALALCVVPQFFGLPSFRKVERRFKSSGMHGRCRVTRAFESLAREGAFEPGDG